MSKQIDDRPEESNATITGIEAKLALAAKIIAKLREDLANVERLLASSADPVDVESLMQKTRSGNTDLYAPMNDGKVVEGVFDGEHMIGSDGKPYVVPPNYASKSKLVEGDILKLTIQSNGTFQYKQIGPIERQRAMGTLAKDEMTGDWRVLAVGKKFNVLGAAVSFHKGEEGDEAVILIPKAAPSKWAALENVIKKE